MDRFKITDTIFQKDRMVIEMYDETGRFAYVTVPGKSSWQQEEPDGVYRTIKDPELIKECDRKFLKAHMDPALTKEFGRR